MNVVGSTPTQTISLCVWQRDVAAREYREDPSTQADYGLKTRYAHNSVC